MRLEEVQESLSFLLLPKEKLLFRKKDSCIDVVTSPNRVNLLEKFLRKRYTLIKDETEESPRALEHCKIDFITKKIRNTQDVNVRLGTQNSMSNGVNSKEEISTSNILLGVGKPGTLEMEGRSLFIECAKGATDIYNLTFSYSEAYRSKVSSSVSVKAGEVLKVGQITNDLKEKSKVLGLPDSLYKDVQGQENISYELVVR